MPDRHGWSTGAPGPVRVAGFRHRVGAHSASGALRDMLEHHALSYAPEPLAEGTVFGLSGALDLQVRIAPDTDDVLALDGRGPSLEGPLCRHLGLSGELLTTDDPAEGWDRVRSELEAGRPVLVRADAAELDYLGDEGHDARHAIVITGHDPAEGLVWVADPRFPEPQRCSLGSLARARLPVRHALLALHAPHRLADPRAAIGAALRRTARSLRGGTREAPESGVLTGLEAIDVLAARWDELPGLAGPRLAQTLRALHFAVRGAGTGGALFRSLQARFEHDAAALLKTPELSRAALVCDDLADAWRGLASATRGADAAAGHRVAGAWVQRVRSLEHHHAEALEACLGATEAAAA